MEKEIIITSDKPPHCDQCYKTCCIEINGKRSKRTETKDGKFTVYEYITEDVLIKDCPLRKL